MKVSNHDPADRKATFRKVFFSKITEIDFWRFFIRDFQELFCSTAVGNQIHVAGDGGRGVLTPCITKAGVSWCQNHVMEKRFRRVVMIKWKGARNRPLIQVEPVWNAMCSKPGNRGEQILKTWMRPRHQEDEKNGNYVWRHRLLWGQRSFVTLRIPNLQ